MKKKLLIVLLTIATVICCVLGLTACGGSENGIYYRVKSGEVDKNYYIELKSGKWSSNEGDSGNYKIDGENITLYITFFGETEIYDTGTIKANILKTDGHTFITEKHTHSFSEWKTDFHATCVSNGQESRSCECGVSQTRESDEKAKGHTPSEYYNFNETEHYHICTVCEVKLEKTNHDNVDSCYTCGYPYKPVVNNILYDVSNGYAVLEEVLSKEATEITIPAEVICLGKLYGIRTIADNAFDGCNNLQSVSITELNASLSSKDGIIYDKKQTNIVQVTPAFKGVDLFIPDSVTSIDKSALASCSSLANITVNSSNKAFASQDGVLYNKDKTAIMYVPQSINGSLVIPDSVTSIGYHTFYNCSSLDSVTIGKGVTEIDSYAFTDCEGLKSVIIQEGTEIIHAYAFSKCNNLTSVSIPDSITQFGMWIHYENKNQTTGNGSIINKCDKVQYTEYGNALYLGNAANPYVVLIKAKNTSITSCEINEKTKIISYGPSINNNMFHAFNGCNSLKSIYFNGDLANWCNLKGLYFLMTSDKTLYINGKILAGNLTIPDGATSIGDRAFNCHKDLTSVTIPDSVTSIGSEAFYGCTGIENVIIPDSVTYYGNKPFNGCPIENATIPTNAISYIKNEALKTVVLISGESIDDSAFYNCNKLTSITIHDGVKEIGANAFNGCNNLINVYYEGDLKSWCCIKGLKNLMSGKIKLYIDGKLLTGNLTIPSGVTSIGDRAFYCRKDLTSVTIPDSVTSIGYEAFYDCIGITSATMPAFAVKAVLRARSDSYLNTINIRTVTITSGESIDATAFYNCSNLSSITLPNSITSIGSSAFENCSSLSSITFNGTKAQWKAIKKDSHWNVYTGNYTLHCTDGDLSKADS